MLNNPKSPRIHAHIGPSGKERTARRPDIQSASRYIKRVISTLCVFATLYSLHNRLHSAVAPRLVEALDLAGCDRHGLTGAGACVAVIDSGITEHYDFGDRVVARVDFTGDGIGDTNGHGTHVAGCIGANGVNLGVAPGVRLVSLKVIDQASGRAQWHAVERALQWVLAHRAEYGITAVNLSINAAMGAPPEDRLDDEIEQLAGARVPCVISAGNDGCDCLTYPAGHPAAIAVAATWDEAPLRLAEFSNRSPAIAIAAPGAWIQSTGLRPLGSRLDAGTSMAAPITAGAIVLYQELYRHLRGELPTVDEIRAALQASGIPFGAGYRALHIGALLDQLKASTAADSSTAPLEYSIRRARISARRVTVTGRASDLAFPVALRVGTFRYVITGDNMRSRSVRFQYRRGRFRFRARGTFWFYEDRRPSATLEYIP